MAMTIILVVIFVIGVVFPMFLVSYSIEKTYKQGRDIVKAIKEDGREWDEKSKKYWAERNKK